MPLSSAGLNIAADAVAAAADYVSVHTGDPGTTGANEVTGGSYARQAKTWNTASGGDADDSNQPVFAMPTGVETTVTHFGLWTAATAGTFLGGAAVSTPETFSTAGGNYTMTDTDITIT